MKPLIMAVLLAWLALTLALGISGAFITPIGEIPYRIAIGIAAPIIVFVAAKFRTVVLTSDLSSASGQFRLACRAGRHRSARCSHGTGSGRL